MRKWASSSRRPPPDRCIRVTGSKGKGTTARLCAERLTATRPGERIGLFVSPEEFEARDRIRIDGEPIQHLPGHKIARKGVVRTFQNVRLFKEMTAVENLLVAQHRHLNTNFLAGLLKTPSFRRSEKAAMEYAAHWLEQVNLTDVANRPAGTLAYGQQRRLEIARCMMTRPRILMLDEPAAGLNPRETEDLKQLMHT